MAYIVLPDAQQPFILARVRWPDVFQAISPVRPYWQDDPGLFDLPYAPGGVRVSHAEATRIVNEWGARLPSEEAQPVPGPQLIRRMPSDWPKFSTAERRAWSIEPNKPLRRRDRKRKHAAANTVIDLTDGALAASDPA